MINFLVQFTSGRTMRIQKPHGWTARLVREWYARKGEQVKVLELGDINHV